MVRTNYTMEVTAERGGGNMTAAERVADLLHVGRLRQRRLDPRPRLEVDAEVELGDRERDRADSLVSLTRLARGQLQCFIMSKSETREQSR